MPGTASRAGKLSELLTTLSAREVPMMAKPHEVIKSKEPTRAITFKLSTKFFFRGVGEDS
eukprot:9352182-Karenia_brevis.AAC.1